jgi:Amt family ammonium transporter
VVKWRGDTRTARNIVWTAVTGFLAMFMQRSLALIETGLTRAKNVAHTRETSFLVYWIGILGFWVASFGLQMGEAGALATFENDRTQVNRVPRFPCNWK